MGASPIPDKCISISDTGVTLGRKVATFFKSQGTLFVNIILNYNNNSLIIMDTGIREEAKLNYTQQGMRVTYETTYKHNTNLKLSRLTSFLNIDYANIFKARPLKKNSIIVENIPLRYSVSVRYHMIRVDMKNKLIMFGNLKQLGQIKIEDITPSESKDKTVDGKLTIITQDDSNLKISSKPIQKSSTNHMPNRENATIDPQEMPAKNSPTQDEIESANREYSKMILGE